MIMLAHVAWQSQNSPLSSVVERVTSTSRESWLTVGHDEVGCSIQPVGILFCVIVLNSYSSYM